MMMRVTSDGSKMVTSCMLDGLSCSSSMMSGAGSVAKASILLCCLDVMVKLA